MPWEYTVTPPGEIDYNAAAAPNATAPGHTDPADLTVTAPDATDPVDRSAIAPDHTDPVDRSVAAPDHTDPADLSATAPVSTAPATFTDQPPETKVWGSADPASLPSMPASFQPAFIEVEGVGATLQTLNANAADAAAGKIVQGTINGVLKSYQVRVGADAEDLPGIVHPANFDVDDNAVVFVQL